MLWRNSFSTLSRTDLAAPEGWNPPRDPHILIGSFEVSATRDCGVWLALVSEAFPSDTSVIRLVISTQNLEVAQQDVEASFARSLRTRTVVIADDGGHWKALVQPDHDDRGFAMIWDGHLIRHLMVGPPTETAWDLFRDAWTPVRT